MNFTAIDFETANNYMNSACSVAVVRVENGKITASAQQLLKPYIMQFNPFHTSIHGIRSQDVQNMPKFDKYWAELKPWLDGQTVIAHYATFDMSVLKALMSSYNLDKADFEYYCSCTIARKVWPKLINHKLSTVAGHIEFDFRHHDALEDARACAMVVLQAMQQEQVTELRQLAKKLLLKGKKF
ncbi:MAG: 3'-5' exonuclease [Negativicutes bacterium]|jgi:DNA polymerase-3 subunit epsilon